MIIDAGQIEQNSEISGNVVIVGAGAAGITLAIELTNQLDGVIVLESGGFDFEADTQSLYDGPIVGHREENLSSSRLRYLGGSTNHWNGQCAPLEPIDFERIPGRRYSGWPFKRDELVAYYARAYPYCELGNFQSESASLKEAQRIGHRILNSPEFELSEFRYSPPTRFGERFRSQLALSKRLTVYLHANLTNIGMSSEGRRVTSLDVQTLTGRKFRVTANFVVLCCGGIENARILLNCTQLASEGIGNQFDLVGRFFMDHLGASGGLIAAIDEHFDLGPFQNGVNADGPVPVRAVFKNSEQIIRSSNRRGCSIFLDPNFEKNADIEMAMKTPAYASFRELILAVKQGRVPVGAGEKI